MTQKIDRPRLLVLGGGRVGGFMAEDLARDEDLSVTVADIRAEGLERLAARARVETVVRDLADPEVVRSLAADFDVVVGALPGRLGFAALHAVIEAGRNCADISFFPEDALALDAAARRRRVTAVVDCGVAPGLAGVLAVREAARLDRAERVRILVGGLPIVRTWPWEYKAPFSPADVIEEYTRPARVKRGGRVVTVPALSEVELLEIPEIGTLESFITDGLRTMLDLDIPEMEERTLRYPGHAERMRMLREAGFLSPEPVTVGEMEVSPLALTSRLLFPAWELGPGEGEFTVLRVEVEGVREGERVRRRADLVEFTDPETGHTSMARTTGLPNTVVARMLARGAFREPGVIPPERLGRDPELARAVLDELARRGLDIQVEETSI